jgi:hypothetical protein
MLHTYAYNKQEIPQHLFYLHREDIVLFVVLTVQFFTASRPSSWGLHSQLMDTGCEITSRDKAAGT